MYQRISDWFEGHKTEMIADIMRLVRHGSVADPQAEVKPFGAECRTCMDEMLQIGREHGFFTENYEYYVGSIGRQTKNWNNMIGFWNHLDVVPVGNDWDYEPFEPVLKGNFIIGRGAQDNKGPAIGILYMMQCLRELGIELKHELCLFVGCDEERGMTDIKYYTDRYPVPALSMIADSGFPVCYGEKGIIEGQMLHRGIPAGLIACGGGHAGNMIPDSAFAELVRTEALESEIRKRFADSTISKEYRVEIEESVIRITASGTSRHSAFPEGSVNAIYKLSSFISSLQSISEALKALFTAITLLSEEYYGARQGIAYSDEVSGATTCAATILKCEGGNINLHFNIRYAITAEAEQILGALQKCAEEHNMCWELERDSAPNYFPKEHPAVQLLTDVYNNLTGEKKESFVMGGGTYARKLPNAFAYGVGGMREPEEDGRLREELFRPGHGGAHEPDEALNVRLLVDAMKIYTMAVIAMNDVEFINDSNKGGSYD